MSFGDDTLDPSNTPADLGVRARISRADELQSAHAEAMRSLVAARQFHVLVMARYRAAEQAACESRAACETASEALDEITRTWTDYLCGDARATSPVVLGSPSIRVQD